MPSIGISVATLVSQHISIKLSPDIRFLAIMELVIDVPCDVDDLKKDVW